MFNNLKKLICMSLLALMLLSSVSASADVTYMNTPVYITANVLNAYQSANTNSKVLGVMTYGEVMQMLYFSGSWACIRNAKGQTGYCDLSGLSTKNPNTLNEVVYANANNTPVYHKASASYKKLGHIQQNTMLNVVAMTSDGQWLRVKNGSTYGYVLRSQVSTGPVVTHGALVQPTVYVNSENAYAVTSKLGGGRTMGNISHGQAYTLLASNSTYAAIRNHKGQIGYCPLNILSTQNTNNLNATMYAQVSGNMLYSNSVIKGEGRYLKKGSAVTVVAKSPEGGWYRVLYGGKYYYVKSVLLDMQPASGSGRQVYSAMNSALYAKANYNSARVGSTYANEMLYLLGMSRHGALVKTASGSIGYLPIDLLEPFEWTFAVRR